MTDALNALFVDAPEPMVSLARRGTGWIVEGANRAYEARFPHDLLDSDAPLREGGFETEYRVLEAETQSSPIVQRRTVHGWKYFRLEVIRSQEVAYLMYQDITQERCLGQQIAVFQRVLCHDLRNQLNVILGCARAGEGATAGLERAAEQLLQMGRRLREVKILDEDPCPLPVDSVARTLAEADAQVSVSGTATRHSVDHRVETGLLVLAEALSDLPGRPVTVEIGVTHSIEAVSFRFQLLKPVLDEQACAALRGETEHAVRAPPDLRLWVASWAFAMAGSRLEVSEDMVDISVPILKTAESAESASCSTHSRESSSST